MPATNNLWLFVGPTNVVTWQQMQFAIAVNYNVLFSLCNTNSLIANNHQPYEVYKYLANVCG